MTKSIPQVGFGVIELLVTLVFILILVMTWMRSAPFQKRKAQAQAFETALRNDLENQPGGELSLVDLRSIDGKTPIGKFQYFLKGEAPNFTAIRLMGDQETELLKNIVSAQFLSYDSASHFLPDHVEGGDLKSISSLKVELFTHEEKETPNFFLNDKVHGVDLDGDPSNGVAKVDERTFIVSLHQ